MINRIFIAFIVDYSPPCFSLRNYRHIIQTSLDGKWVDGGEFPLLLGSYATIPKAPRGGSINWEDSFFLDVVHVDIAFGDCVLVGGFRYSLIFVDRATRYNWVFGLKDLSKESIVIPNFLVQQLRSIWLITTPILLLLRRVASLPTVLLNPIGKSWSTWLGLT